LGVAPRLPTISANPSGGTLGGTLTVAVSGGIATFSDLAIDLAGDGKLTLKGHEFGVTTVSISSDGRRIVSGDALSTVKVWDAATGQEKLTLKGHKFGVTTVSISSDGQRIVSGSEDGTIKVWEADPAKRSGKQILLSRSQPSLPSASTR
jgi:WD40 repeat protein